METIRCETYHCTMTAAACAARHLNAVAGGSTPVGRARAGSGDPNCRACPEGMARAEKIGGKGIKAYSASLKNIRNNAWGALKDQQNPNKAKEESIMTDKTAVEEKPVKTCKKCGEVKPLDLFPKNHQCKDGVSGTCKSCRARIARKRYRANKTNRVKPGDSGQKLENPAGTVIGTTADHTDFARLAALLSAGKGYDLKQLSEIKTLCGKVMETVETYFTLRQMFHGK